VNLMLLRTKTYLAERLRGQQTCKVCGRPQNEVDFCVASREWSAIVPAQWDGRAVCLACFERFAYERGRCLVKVFLVDGP
jgi:CRISPR/Cas system-associated protein Cas10 (large subunit of type III CRISPR-Cas system)